jgi:tetratricopeptide (TPR) repeat protein
MKHSLLYIILLMFETDALPSWAQRLDGVSPTDATALLPFSIHSSVSATSADTQLVPLNYAYYLARGQYRSQQHDFAGALADFNKALHLRPHDVQALAGRGYTYYQTARYKAALIDYNHCLRLAPGNADIFYKRGLLKVKLQEIEAAIADFDKAIALAPRHYSAQMARASCQTYLSGDDSSLDELDQAAAVTHW